MKIPQLIVQILLLLLAAGAAFAAWHFDPMKIMGSIMAGFMAYLCVWGAVTLALGKSIIHGDPDD